MNLKKLLESHFWPETLKPNTVYERVHDDHDGTYEGRVTIWFDRQGDAWLSTDKHAHLPMRFRTWGGGGMSLRVRNALLILAEAIRLDNKERPQHGAPASDDCAAPDRGAQEEGKQP